jgi:1,4-alpha-glucan branching enzyme
VAGGRQHPQRDGDRHTDKQQRESVATYEIHVGSVPQVRRSTCGSDTRVG